MKILVISLAGIGDTLLATPLFRALREQLPEARIDVLVMWSGSQDLLRGNQRINEVYQCNLLQNSHLKNIAFLAHLRRQRYDVSINAYPQGKIHYRAIARFIGAARRISHTYENHNWLDHWLVTDLLDQDYSIHCLENNLNLLPFLGLKIPKDLDCEVFFTPAELEWADTFARSQHLAERTVIGLHVGSGKTKNLVLKRWPVEHYVEVIQNLLAGDSKRVLLLFGGPEEKADNEAILGAVKSDRVVPVPSRTIRQAAAVLRHCGLFLSVDNAFMHLAATMKVPRQVVIESPTFNQTIEPYRRPFRLVRNPLVAGRNLDYYRYDGRDIQGGREHLLECMRSITPPMVREALEQELAILAKR